MLLTWCTRVDQLESDEPYGCTLLWQYLCQRLCCKTDRPRNSPIDLQLPPDADDDLEQQRIFDGDTLQSTKSNPESRSASGVATSDVAAAPYQSSRPVAVISGISAKLEETPQADFTAHSLVERSRFAFKTALIAILSSLFVLIPDLKGSVSEALASSSSATSSFTSMLARAFEDNALWVPISAVLVLELSVGAALRKSVLRVVGTIVGWYEQLNSPPRAHFKCFASGDMFATVEGSFCLFEILFEILRRMQYFLALFIYISTVLLVGPLHRHFPTRPYFLLSLSCCFPGCFAIKSFALMSVMAC